MHPWVFSGAVARDPRADAGDIVPVYSDAGEFLAWATYHPGSQIRARCMAWSEAEYPHADFIFKTLRDAKVYRESLKISANCFRLCHGESDGIPGLIVDVYSDTIVIQSLTAGSDRLLPEVVKSLVALFNPRCIYERSDEKVREFDGLQNRVGLLYGADPGVEGVVVEEYGVKFAVDVLKGHKTGTYLDQREARRFVAASSQSLDVLNCFSYTGGFSVAAKLCGAKSVCSVDSSGPSLEIAKKNFVLNGLHPDSEGISFVVEDVFKALRKFQEESTFFDVIILDPPKFVQNKGQLDRGLRAYKDINLIAMQILRPQGRLATFSCSGLVSADLFQKVVFGASKDAGVDFQIQHRFQQPADHPVRLSFPESDYLKGLFLSRV